MGKHSSEERLEGVERTSDLGLNQVCRRLVMVWNMVAAYVKSGRAHGRGIKQCFEWMLVLTLFFIVFT